MQPHAASERCSLTWKDTDISGKQTSVFPRTRLDVCFSCASPNSFPDKDEAIKTRSTKTHPGLWEQVFQLPGRRQQQPSRQRFVCRVSMRCRQAAQHPPPQPAWSLQLPGSSVLALGHRRIPALPCSSRQIPPELSALIASCNKHTHPAARRHTTRTSLLPFSPFQSKIRVFLIIAHRSK